MGEADDFMDDGGWDLDQMEQAVIANGVSDTLSGGSDDSFADGPSGETVVAIR